MDMGEFGGALPLLVGLALALAILAWLSRQISLRVQMVVFLTTRSANLAMLVLFLLLLPGIFVHEAAHWLAAKVLGLKTSKFRVWPRPKGKHIGMGSVSVQRGNLWQDGLVGVAPLLAGTAAIALIGDQIFQANAVSAVLWDGLWGAALVAFWQALGGADGALWAYLLFAIANAMMPSPSDREPLKPVLIYSGLTLLIYLVLGLPLNPFQTALTWLTPTLQIITSSLIFTILLDGLILLALYMVQVLVAPRISARA
jgi:hypothetical protein